MEKDKELEAAEAAMVDIKKELDDDLYRMYIELLLYGSTEFKYYIDGTSGRRE